MPSDEAQTAFFSYCREDSEFALKLAEDLKAAGANVWIDQIDIEPGAEWDSAVEEALNASPRMLVILSPVSVNSKNVRDEVSFALNEGKRVIPVLYRDCKVPFRLARLQQIDFRADYARGLKILLRAIGVEQPVLSPPAAASAAIAEQLVAVVDAQRAAEQARTDEEERKSADLAARLTAIKDAERAAATARAEEEERKRKADEEKERQDELERQREAAQMARLQEERRLTEKARLEQQKRERKEAEAPAYQEQLRRQQRASEQARLKEEARQHSTPFEGSDEISSAATSRTDTIEVGSTRLNRWWRVVGGLLMNLALGTLYAWSVFVAPLEKEFGWKRADTSTVFTIAVVVFALTFIVAGRLQDKLGPFWISLTGAVLVSLGFFLCSYTSSLTYLFICFGVIGGLGNGFGYATPIPVMAKWFPDKRGLAVGLAVGGYGAGSAIFGPLAASYLIPNLGWRTTFQVLGVIFFVMTVIGAFLLKNPPAGYRPAGWTPAPSSKAAASTYDFTPGEMLRTPTFYFMWIAYAFGCAAGLMVISQLVPFAKSVGIPSITLASFGLVVGAVGNASGRILSGWMSDHLGRINVLRLMIGISMVAMPILYHSDPA